jgi:hypothetical protein
VRHINRLIETSLLVSSYSLILILILAFALALTGCGQVDISDSSHEVRHTIGIQDLHYAIVNLCGDAYIDPIEQQECMQDTLRVVLNSINDGTINASK